MSGNSVEVPMQETPPMAPEEEVTTVERPDNVPEKFWNAEKGEVDQDAMLKSYSELESKNSQADDDSETPDNEEGESTGVASLLKSQGLDQADFTAELETNGKLSDESYSKLEKAGFDKATVDQYIAGAQVGDYQATLAENDINEIQGSVDNYDGMVDWASQNMTAEQLESYNNMVSSGNKQQALAAVNWANSLYTEAEGNEPNLLNGGADGTDGSVYRSHAEVTKAMRDTRYGKDKAYTEDVMKKVGRSNVF